MLDDEDEDVVVVESGDINTDLGHRENLSDVLETLDE